MTDATLSAVIIAAFCAAYLLMCLIVAIMWHYFGDNNHQ